MELVWREFGEVLSLNLDIDTNYDLLIETLRAAGVCRVHFHTLVDIPEKLHNIAQDLGAPIDFTIHDYYSVCPRIDLIYAAEGGYCGEKGEAQCKTCLQKSPALGEIDIKTWRSRNARFMTHASRVFAPSRDVEKRMLRYVPDIAITVVPHPEPVAVVPALRNIVCLPAERPLRIFVLGALTGAKGADVLEACAVDAAKRNLPLHFELIGFSYRTMCVVPDASLVVHGRYRDGELATLLKFHAPDLVWFPALSPETYSYTLSAALAAGLPVVVPDLGALAERVAARPWSWIVDWKLKPAEMNDWFVTLREKSFAGAVDAGAMSEAGAKPGSGFDYVHEYLQPVGNAARRPVDFIDYSALAEKICVVSKRPQVVHADHEVSTIRAVTREGAEVVRSILAAHRHLRVALLRIAKILWWSITLQLFAQYRRWRAQQIDRPHFAPPTNDHAVVVPFQYVSSTGGIAPNLAVVCHMFFAEMADEFKGYLSNIPFGFDLYITTDRDEKKLQIEAAFKSWRSGNVEVRITPNRGRDIAPKLITCFDVYSRYEFVLHLHTKNSPHARHLAGWRKYLLETLVGSPAIVTSVFEVFQRHPRVGMISPQHFEGIRPGVGWGRNYAQVNSVARRLALKIDLDGSLDFPSGSMFWARSAALVPLLNIGLSFDDFPPEQGQQDGTPAHVIERLYFYVCETAGFDWIKIARPELLRDSGRRAIHAINPGALSDFIDTHRVRLLSNIRAKCDEGKTVQSDIRRNVRLSRHQLQIFRTAHKNSVYRYLEFADFIESVVDLAEGKASIIDFDEVFYLSTYPDVNESVRNGGFPCGYIHYCVAGKNEGRFWRAREPAGAPGILAEIATYTPTGRA
jgi:glycosyltransferase involved in cell wall biosynthesis